MRVFLVLLLATSLSACATTGSSAARDPADPYESFNRGMWGFNQAVDKGAVKPVTKVYRTVTPIPLRRGFSRVLNNLFEPFSAINSLLQGKPNRALNSIARFAINSTIGVGGLADHASDMGLRESYEDFGQTLGVWGAKESPYLVLPLLGPSTIRDGVGTAVQMFADPAQMVVGSELKGDAQTAYSVGRALNERSQLMETGADEAIAAGADPYATARSAYLQRRRAQIRDETAAGETEDADEALDKAIEQETGQKPEAQPESQPKQ
jgi:phospholipid-binding lipoprotein MlaA